MNRGTRSLERLLRPKSIAVFGGNWASNVISQCQRMGFKGEVWPVHPSKQQIAGLPCYQSVLQLPGAPDASFIGVNRDLTLDIIEALSQRGAGGAVCFASGFSEVENLTGDGKTRQASLVEKAGAMPVLGPNCYGLINYLDGALLWPDQHGGQLLAELSCNATGVAVVMQSSNMAINVTMQQRGLPLAYVVCAGNQAQTDAAGIVDTLLDDHRVTVIGVHIEGIKDVAAFEAVAAKARRLGKPLVALTIGRSDAAQTAALSHTASIAGDAVASRAFFEQLGIPVSHSVPSFLETLKLLHVHGALSGRRLSSMSCSGGEASLIADTALRYNVQFPALSASDKQRIAATLNELVVVANPLDYHTFIWGDEEAMVRTFSAMLIGDFDLNLLVLDFPRLDRCSDTDWHAVVRAITRAAGTLKRKVAVVASLPENLPELWSRSLMDSGIAPLHGLNDAMAAAEAAAQIGEAWSRPAAKVWPTTWAYDASSRKDGTLTLDEHAAKTQLANAGVRTPDARVVSTADEAVNYAIEIGLPVVAKALDIAHKTESDAVYLSLDRPDAVRAAASHLLTLSPRILIERMVKGEIAQMLIGVHRDPVYGLMLTVGAGGVLVELLDDTVTLRMPVDRQQLLEKIRTLRMYPVLEGYRGSQPGDVEALLDAIMAVQVFVEQHQRTLSELDINPLLILPQTSTDAASLGGTFAVDALLTFIEE